MGACPGVAGAAGVNGTRRGGLPRRCRCGGRQRYPAGGLPALLPACPATAVPAGGVPALSPVNPAFNLLPCPHPPDPLPGGKGEIFCFLMQGASPLASPGLNPGGTGLNLPCWCSAGACPVRGGASPPAPLRLSRRRHWERGRSRHRRGGWLFRFPDLPAVAVPFCPHPPYPLPGGKGEFLVFLCKGLRPLHPRG